MFQSSVGILKCIFFSILVAVVHEGVCWLASLQVFSKDMASTTNRYIQNNLSAIIFSCYKRKESLVILFKALEERKVGKKKIHIDEHVSMIINTWDHLCEFILNCCVERAELLLQWLNCHTIDLVLLAEWETKVSQDTKQSLRSHVCRFKKIIEVKRNITNIRLLLLLKIIKCSWNHDALVQILNGIANAEEKEELFFHSERGELINARLLTLCDNKCEDMAINYAAAALRYIRRQFSIAPHIMTTAEICFVIDIYIALLYKYKRTAECIAELKLLDLRESLNFIYRFAKKNPKELRLWKYRYEITELAAQVFLASAMAKPKVNKTMFIELIKEWATVQSKLPDLPSTLSDMITKIIQPAASAFHIYTFCEVITKKFGDKVKLLTIELYIRALTTDMNELENQKTEGNKVKVKHIENRLSAGFLLLADVLNEDTGVCRECVLTAFSLNPTPSCYRRIKELAILSGKLKTDPKGRSGGPTAVDTGQDSELKHTKSRTNSTSVDNKNNTPTKSPKKWECINHSPIDQSTIMSAKPSLVVQCHLCGEFVPSSYLPPSSPMAERTLDALISIKGDTVTQSSNYDVLSAPNQVLDAKVLNIPKHLRADLAVIICSPRVKMFSWVLGWSKLSEVCENYLNCIDGSRCRNPELKYLKIDYNQFKNSNFHNGIAKGCEHVVESSAEESESIGYSDSGGCTTI